MRNNTSHPVLFADGRLAWYIDNTNIDEKAIIHREDGPAYEWKRYGIKQWHQNGSRHRVGGPAIEYANGHKEWWLNGQCHREDGPAIEDANGYKEWYYHGKHIKCKSQQEFEKQLKLKIFW